MVLESFVNVFRVPELRKKALLTLGILALCRVGIYIPVPGVNVQGIGQLYKSIQGTDAGKILGLVDLFAGGGIRNCAIFGLGIMPYISASIIFQLLASVIPFLEKLQKEGEAGRRKIQQYTRMATVPLCFIQALITIQGLAGQAAVGGMAIFPASMAFRLKAALVLTTGTMLLMWLGEQIDEYGIGNGISLIIFSEHGFITPFVLEITPIELSTL